MKRPRRAHPPASDERSVAPFPGRFSRWRLRLAAFHWRDFWWRLLDFLEESRAGRLGLYGAAAAVVIGFAAWFWAYPRWERHNSIKIAREWLASGHLRYAAEAAQRAAAVAPENPEPWQIASELARLGGQKDKALDYARHAAELAPADPVVVTEWAAAALRADNLEETEQALDHLTPGIQAASPHVQRLRGEIARRRQAYTAARDYFEAARRIDGPLAVDEVPLGLILLRATNPTARKRGLDLLTKWTADREWAATALRTLLADAVARDDKPAMRKWAEALRTNPGCTVGDMPNCLLALGQADEARFVEVLAQLEKNHAVTPQAAAQLLSWLNQIGRGVEAVRWMKTLPAPAMQRPPLVVAGAEALRLAADWPGLQEWTQQGNWGPEVEFLRWAYGFQAAHMLGNEAQATALWQTLYSHAQINGAHGLFAAATLYSWGRQTEAVDLWWRVAEQEGKIAIDSLGSLARHYQARRDADGLYRVFRKLHLLQPQDTAVGNNFAFYAVLTGHEQRVAEEIAQANLTAEPRNLIYLATRAFALFMQHRAEAAMLLLQPVAAEAARSPALAFTYGLALAGTGHKAEAHALLDPLPPDSLTLKEVDVIRTALAD